jgi:hypothetical protein
MPETQSLEEFLAGLPDEDAANAQVAAARIDELEREAGPPGWIERNLIWLVAVSLVLFVIGAGALFGVFAWGRVVLGLGGITIMVGAFPAVMLTYLLSVRGRTGADHEKMALNEAHFLPHGGLYFGGNGGTGKVTRVSPPKKTEINLRDRTMALHKDATRQNW